MSFNDIPPILRDIEYNELRVITCNNDDNKLVSLNGFHRTDHMLEINWNDDKGWSDPCIKPYQMMDISPISSVFQSGLQVSMNIKAYVNEKKVDNISKSKNIDYNDSIYLFRPKKYIEYFLNKSELYFFPTFQINPFLDCLYELIRMERKFIPIYQDGYLNIQICMISTHESLEMEPAYNVKLFVILAPNYIDFDEPLNSMDVNFSKNIFHKNMQYFFKLKNENKIITLDLSDNIFKLHERYYYDHLICVNRDSIIKILKSDKESETFNHIKMDERLYTVHNILNHLHNDNIEEAFGCNDNEYLFSINSIQYNDTNYPITNNSSSQISTKLHDIIKSLIIGKNDHPWSIPIS